MIILSIVYGFLILCLNAPIKSSPSTQVTVSKFEKLSADILLYISEYCDNNPVSPLRFLNRFTMKSIPSVQQRLAVKFDCNLFKSLPLSPELFHLINFKHNLHGLVQDSSRFLENSSPIIMEAALHKYVDKSLHLDDKLLIKVMNYAIDNKNSRLFAKLLAKSSIASLHKLPKDFLLESLEVLSHNEADLEDIFTSGIEEENANYFAIALFLSNLPLTEILSKLETLHLEAISIFEALLEAIKISNRNSSNYQKFKEIILGLHGKFNDARCQTILELLISLKFDPQAFNIGYYVFFLKELHFFISAVWREIFIDVSIQVGRFDVGRVTLISNSIPKSLELRNLISRQPRILAGSTGHRIASMFGYEYLEYRIVSDPQDFDEGKEITTAEDVIVSAYIHTNAKFVSVLERMDFYDFREWAQVIDRLLSDPVLKDKLKVFADCLKVFSTFPEMIFSEIRFPVLKEILLNFTEYLGLFDNALSYKIMVPPEVMAQVLRDNQLYRIFRDNKNVLFPKMFFSFIDAVHKFILFDWERMFALSLTPLNFEKHNARSTLNIAHMPQNCVTLNYSLDLVKHNFIDLLLMENSIESIKFSSDKYVMNEPLLHIWARTDPVSFNQNFPEENSNK